MNSPKKKATIWNHDPMWQKAIAQLARVNMDDLIFNGRKSH
jgi:hypothetical protein